jgi:hypothetical protein
MHCHQRAVAHTIITFGFYLTGVAQAIMSFLFNLAGDKQIKMRKARNEHHYLILLYRKQHSIHMLFRVTGKGGNMPISLFIVY